MMNLDKVYAWHKHYTSPKDLKGWGTFSTINTLVDLIRVAPQGAGFISAPKTGEKYNKNIGISQATVSTQTVAHRLKNMNWIGKPL